MFEEDDLLSLAAVGGPVGVDRRDGVAAARGRAEWRHQHCLGGEQGGASRRIAAPVGSDVGREAGAQLVLERHSRVIRR